MVTARYSAAASAVVVTSNCFLSRELVTQRRRLCRRILLRHRMPPGRAAAASTIAAAPGDIRAVIVLVESIRCHVRCAARAAAADGHVVISQPVVASSKCHTAVAVKPDGRGGGPTDDIATRRISIASKGVDNGARHVAYNSVSGGDGRVTPVRELLPLEAAPRSLMAKPAWYACRSSQRWRSARRKSDAERRYRLYWQQ